jgi:TonB family protein
MKKLIALVLFAYVFTGRVAIATISMASSQDVRIAQQTIPNAVIPPRISAQTVAEYTVGAYRDKIEGSVIVQAQFDVDGTFTVLKVVQGLGYGLNENALAALQHWHFSPAMKNGERVSVIAEIEIPFKLSSLDLRHRSEMNRQIRCMNNPDRWGHQCRK